MVTGFGGNGNETLRMQFFKLELIWWKWNAQNHFQLISLHPSVLKYFQNDTTWNTGGYLGFLIRGARFLKDKEIIGTWKKFLIRPTLWPQSLSISYSEIPIALTALTMVEF